CYPAAGAAADAADLRQQCDRAFEGHGRRLADLAHRHDLPGAGRAGADRQHADPLRDDPRALFPDGARHLLRHALAGAPGHPRPRWCEDLTMEWDWNFVWQIMPTLLDGLKITVLATVLGAALAAVIGLVFAILRMTAPKPIARVTGFIVEFIRGTPLLVQLYFIFFVLPDIGIRLPALLAGVIGLGLHYGTYAAEVYRAGIQNVPRGQWEAAKATNLTGRQTWIHVILPQAI